MFCLLCTAASKKHTHFLTKGGGGGGLCSDFTMQGLPLFIDYLEKYVVCRSQLKLQMDRN